MTSTMSQILATCPILLVIQLAAAQWNTWEKQTPSGSSPSARWKHSAVWSNDLLGMLIFGGYDGSRLNDLHLYRSELNSWEQLSPSGSWPPGRNSHSAVWSNDLRGMLIFGGCCLEGYQRHNDLHLYRSESNSWEQLSPSGAWPSTRTSHSAVWSNDLGGMLIFGGYDGSDGIPLNDLHLYRSELNSWQQLGASGSWPSPRYSHSAVWSNDLGGMLIFGGYGRSELNDLHLYRSELNSWDQLSPSGSWPSARSGHSAVWSNELRGMLMFGGKYREDLHFYSSELNSWEELFPMGRLDLSGRTLHSAVWSNESGDMLIFGGYAGSSLLNDLQIYHSKLSSSRTVTSSTFTTRTVTSSTFTTRTVTTSTFTTITVTETSTSSTSTTTRTSVQAILMTLLPLFYCG